MGRVCFPHWRLEKRGETKEVSVRPAVADGLIAFHLSAGRHDLWLSHRTLGEEIIGAGISSLTLISLVFLIARKKEIRLVTAVLQNSS